MSAASTPASAPTRGAIAELLEDLRLIRPDLKDQLVFVLCGKGAVYVLQHIGGEQGRNLKVLLQRVPAGLYLRRGRHLCGLQLVLAVFRALLVCPMSSSSSGV